MKTCFVIMGFGKKTDYRQSREFDLDKTYRYIIQPAVKDCGLDCVRADEELSAGLIDVPMYERLQSADVVIADLSTANLNAMYELGVRHALRPRTTIAIAESGFQNPFDTNHLRVLRYEHLGTGIDFGEVQRMQALLKSMLQAAANADSTDSPVYALLSGLQPPVLTRRRGAPDGMVASPPQETFAALMADAMSAKGQGDFARARGVLQRIREAQKDRPDAYVVQQLALVTYKSKVPNLKQALLDARVLLQDLKPEHSNDPETLGLWGAIHKRLAELPPDQLDDKERSDALESAIAAYQKGFILRDDYYNGINYAFLLDRRARLKQGDERVADRVEARRVRKRVAQLCRQLLASGFSHLQDPVREAEERFWVRATLVEALVGSGSPEAEAELTALRAEGAPQAWMIISMDEQLAALRALLHDAE